MTQRLIHLGLQKTASSTMQDIWGNMPQVALSKEYTIKTAKHLSDVIWGRVQEDFTLPQDIPVFSACSEHGGDYEIYTAENLSNPGFECFDPTRTGLFHQYSAEIFQAVVGEAKVLLVVREPKSWLFSQYKQYVQEGGHLTLQRFLDSNEAALAHVLEINNILAHWAFQFGFHNIIILPFELMRDEPDVFFYELTRRAGLPQDGFVPQHVRNKSIGNAEADFMRSSSRMMQFFVDNLSAPESWKMMLRDELKLFKDLMRKELQENPRGRIARAAKRLGQDDWPKATLPTKVEVAIRDQFLPTIREFNAGLNGYMPLYEGRPS